MVEYKRIMLKLSGESLAGSKKLGIDADALNSYATDIRDLTDQGIETTVVLGGGNIFRGLQGVANGVDRVHGDQMGMLATIINSMALQSALEGMGVKAKVLSGVPVETMCEKMSRNRALALLAEGYVVIIAGGTGNPFFTTDSAAALAGTGSKSRCIPQRNTGGRNLFSRSGKRQKRREVRNPHLRRSPGKRPESDGLHRLRPV